MDGIKGKFYLGLQADMMAQDFTQTFLYRYLKKKKDQAGVREDWLEQPPRRGDRYILLRTYFWAMEQGKLSQGECLQRLQELLQKAPKLRSREASRALDRCRKALSRPGGQWSGEEWAALEKELLQRVLKIDATAFLYDAGVPLSGDGRGRASTASSNDKKDRMLDMLDAYCKEKPGILGGGMADRDLDEAQRQAIEACYQTMRASEEYENVFLPIRIDPACGAGLYIVGKTHFDAGVRPTRFKGLKEDKHCHCYYVCFTVDDAALIEVDGEERTVNCFTLSCYPETKLGGEPLMAICGFPNLDEALSWYNHYVSKALSYYEEENGAPPPNCPEMLRMYFAGWSRERDRLTGPSLAETAQLRREEEQALRQEEQRKKMLQGEKFRGSRGW